MLWKNHAHVYILTRVWTYNAYTMEFLMFQQMDQNRDGVISIDEFMDTCRSVSLHIHA